MGDYGVVVKLMPGEPEQPTMKTRSRGCGRVSHTRKDISMQVRGCTTQKIGFFFSAGLIAGLTALPAIAGTPAVLDHVPADAQAVFVVSNLGETLNELNALNAMSGQQGGPMVMMVTSMVRGMPGINLDGSVAAVFEFIDGQEEPEVVILVPVSDFAALSDGMSINGGVVSMPIGGDMMYFRDAGGGYAVLGESDGRARDFDASSGNLKAHKALLGKAGGRIADGNDVFVYVNFEGFKDEIAMGMQGMEAQGEMIEMMGGAEAVAGFDAMMSVVQTIANDGASFVMGVNFDEEVGVGFDAGLQFKDGSTSASYLQNNGDAGKYFSNVPAMDYFFASAFDISGSGIQKMLGGYMEMIQKFDTTGQMIPAGMSTLMGDVKGGIQVMGASDNIMGGLFSKTMYYMEVKDADAYLDATQTMYSNMNEQMKELAQVGVKVNASMDAEPTEINGVDAYGYSFAMDMSGMDMGGGMGGPNPAMILGMIFGADGGPSGYMAKVGNGIAATLSKDADFFSQVAASANGENTMSGNASIAQTAAMLPSNRIMETYLAADHLVNTAGPMLMMFGAIPEFEPLGALPPIGMACTADGGGVMFRTIVPMETIGAVMEMVPAEAMGGGHGGGDGSDEMDF